MPHTVGVAHDPRQTPRLGGDKSSSGRTNDVRRTDPCSGKPSPVRPWLALPACRSCARYSYSMDPTRVISVAIYHDGERWICPNRIAT